MRIRSTTSLHRLLSLLLALLLLAAPVSMPAAAAEVSQPSDQSLVEEDECTAAQWETAQALAEPPSAPEESVDTTVQEDIPVPTAQEEPTEPETNSEEPAVPYEPESAEQETEAELTPESDVPEAATEEPVAEPDDDALLPDELLVEEGIAEEQVTEAAMGAVVKSYALSDSVTAVLDENGLLTISGTGEVPDYGEMQESWTNERYSIQSVVVEEGITSIGEAAFYGCYSLKQAQIASSVTSIDTAAFADTDLNTVTGMSGVKTMGDYVFQGTSLDTLTLPEGLESIGDYLFYESSLRTLNLPASLKTVGGVAYGAAALESITVASGSQTLAGDSGILFSRDKKALLAYPANRAGTSYGVPNGVEEIGNYAFSNNRNLEQVTLPDSLATLGEGAFFQMNHLKEITIPSSVKSMGKFLLMGCSSLNTLRCNASVEQTVYQMCMDCTALTTAIFQSKTLTILINRTFANCSALTDVTLPQCLEEIHAGAFANCSALTTLNYPDTLTLVQAGAFQNAGVKTFPSWLHNPGDGSYCVAGVASVSGVNDYEAAFAVLKLVNQERAKTGAGALQMDQDLLKAAMLRSAEISLIFSHDRPNGLSCFSACSKMFGENIAMGSTTAAGVMNQWMNSQGHRENILNKSYSSIGIGCFVDKDGYWHWVQCFGWDDIALASGSTQKKSVTVPVVISSENLSSGDLELIGEQSLPTGSKTQLQLLYAGAPMQLSDFTLASNNPQIASVNTDGWVTAHGNGSYQITASLLRSQKVQVRFSGKVTNPKQSQSPTKTAQKQSQNLTVTAPSVVKGKTVKLSVKGSYGKLTYTSNNKSVATVTSTGVVKGLKPGTVTITVKAAGDGSHAAASKQVKITVYACTTPKITKLQNVYGGVKITAGSVKGAAKYRFFYKVNGSGWKKAGDSASPVFIWKGAKNGKAYSFTVRCMNKDGAYISDYDKTGKNVTYVAVPNLAAAKNAKAATARIAWKKLSGVTGFQIQYSTSKTFKSGNKTVLIKKAAATSKDITGLSRNKTYYFRIRSYKVLSGKSIWSAWSAVKPLKITK